MIAAFDPNAGEWIRSLREHDRAVIRLAFKGLSNAALLAMVLSWSSEPDGMGKATERRVHEFVLWAVTL